MKNFKHYAFDFFFFLQTEMHIRIIIAANYYYIEPNNKGTIVYSHLIFIFTFTLTHRQKITTAILLLLLLY